MRQFRELIVERVRKTARVSAQFSSVRHDWFDYLRPEGLHQSECNGKNDRSEYESQQSENTDAAKNGEEDKKFVQFGLVLNQFRSQEIIYCAHNKCAPNNQQHRFDPMAG